MVDWTFGFQLGSEHRDQKRDFARALSATVSSTRISSSRFEPMRSLQGEEHRNPSANGVFFVSLFPRMRVVGGGDGTEVTNEGGVGDDDRRGG